MTTIVELLVLLAVTALSTVAAAFPGDLVPTFGSGGVVVDETIGPGEALAIQPDGAIVVVQEGHRLARYDANGNPDPSFGVAGSVTTTSAAAAIALQPDGMIVVAGHIAGQLTVERYDTAGAPDPLFGTAGVVTVPGPPATNVVIQSTGAIVTGGGSLLARFTTAGVLDGTFGTGGTVDTSANGDVTALALGAGDALVTAAEGGDLVSAMVIARYDADGAPDSGFASGGVFTTTAENVKHPEYVAIQADGGIVVTGYDYDQQFFTLRVTAGGMLDASFGGDGIVVTPFGNGISIGKTVTVEPNGKIGVAGSVLHTDPIVPFNLALVRFTPDGTLDVGFGNAGQVESDLGDAEFITAGARDGETLVVTGTTAALASGRFFMARYALGEICGQVMPSCKGGPPKKALLHIREDADDAKNRFQWTYRNGDATTLAELGDPRVADRYLICLFDESGMTPHATVNFVIPPGGTCSGKPCWRALGASGFKYQSKQHVPQGIESLAIRSGAAGKAHITFKGRGPALPTVDLPPGLPMRMRLQAQTGACWESTFSTAGVIRNDGNTFRGRSD